MSLMPHIRFSHNWNSKLNTDWFTTIRLWTPEKWEYYQSLVGKEVKIIMGDRIHFPAKVCNAEESTIMDLPYSTIVCDTGMEIHDAYELFEKFYHKKDEWNKWQTKMILITLHRIRPWSNPHQQTLKAESLEETMKEIRTSVGRERIKHLQDAGLIGGDNG